MAPDLRMEYGGVYYLRVLRGPRLPLQMIEPSEVARRCDFKVYADDVILHLLFSDDKTTRRQVDK